MSQAYLNSQKSQKIIRTTKHYLGYSTNVKNEWLDKLFLWYKIVINDCLKWMYDNLESNNIIKPFGFYKSDLILSVQYEAVIYKNASEIIRGQLKLADKTRYKNYKKVYDYCKKHNKCKWFTDKKYSELNLKPVYKSRYFSISNNDNITITLDYRMVDFKNGNKFDEFVRIFLPFVTEDSIEKNLKCKHRISIKLPFKHYKHSNKYNKSKEWTRKKSIQLIQKDGKYFLILFYEKNKPQLKSSENVIGVDQGINKLLTTSNGLFFGKELKSTYIKISNKIVGSKNWKQYVYYKNTEIKRITKSFIQYCIDNNINEIVLEDLIGARHAFNKENAKNNTSRKYNKHITKSISHYWNINIVKNTMEQMCELNGIKLTYVSRSYTSQKCSNCGYVDTDNRNKELFQCLHCGYIIDADINAAINILHRRVCSPSKQNKLKQ